MAKRRANGEGCIYSRRDKDGRTMRWIGEIRKDGKRVCVYGKTQQEVHQKLINIKKGCRGMSEQVGLTIFQHEQRYWVVDVVRRDGSRNRVYGRTKREALRNYADALGIKLGKGLRSMEGGVEA